MMRLVPPAALAALVLGLLTTGVTVAAPASQLRAQETYPVSSPDGSLTLVVSTGQELSYSVRWRGRTLVEASPIGISLTGGGGIGRLPDGRGPSPAAVVLDTSQRSVDTRIRPVVPEKRAVIRDHFNEITLTFDGGWMLDLRAYDDGVAYRFRTTREGPLEVATETFTAAFPGDPMAWYPREESLLTHQERVYEELTLSGIEDGAFASIPVLVAPADLPKVLITESDLRDYPGMYLEGTGRSALDGLFPAYPLEEEQTRDRTVEVTRRGDFLARTTGPRSFPWRLFIVAEKDTDLVESTLVYQLAPELRLDDTSWIRPGKVAWDWWNASSLHGVDFESGLNAATYHYFIDFAADHGIDYIILDEGWSDTRDFTAMNAEMDVPSLFRHGKERGVGIIPWVVWKTLDDDLDASLDRFAEWGAVGIKVDFMQRDDQPMVNYYWRVAEAAAKRHLFVDFHGAYKPSGLRRAYPNVLTREGVQGLEHSKWDSQPTPKHNVTLPYLRMVAGPMDYTPGAMHNAQEARFHPIFDRPMSMGTRVHQMAMYVVFESPLQMLADSPSNYLDEEECLDFIAGVPTVWDETRVISGEVGEWIALARRRGSDWYVGAMTNSDPRELELDLSFLGPGLWEGEVFQDGANATRNAEDYRRLEMAMEEAGGVTVRLAPGGGWVARFSSSTRTPR